RHPAWVSQGPPRQAQPGNTTTGQFEKLQPREPGACRQCLEGRVALGPPLLLPVSIHSTQGQVAQLCQVPRGGQGLTVAHRQLGVGEAQALQLPQLWARSQGLGEAIKGGGVPGQAQMKQPWPEVVGQGPTVLGPQSVDEQSKTGQGSEARGTGQRRQPV